MSGVHVFDKHAPKTTAFHCFHASLSPTNQVLPARHFISPALQTDSDGNRLFELHSRCSLESKYMSGNVACIFTRQSLRLSSALVSLSGSSHILLRFIQKSVIFVTNKTIIFVVNGF